MSLELDILGSMESAIQLGFDLVTALFPIYMIPIAFGIAVTVLGLILGAVAKIGGRR